MTDTESDQIRRRMANIRHDMREEVDGIVDNARELTDWQHYVRKWPWAAMASAAALGFLAVPQKTEVISPDAETLAKLAKQNRLVVESQPEAAAKSSGLAATMFTLASSTLLRAGVAYLGQQVGALISSDPPDKNEPIATGDVA